MVNNRSVTYLFGQAILVKYTEELLRKYRREGGYEGYERKLECFRQKKDKISG